MKLIRPENYNGHFTRFKMLTMMQLGQFKWIPRRGAEETVNGIMKPALRYALSDCIELPPTIYHDREAELSAEQKVHYKALERQAVTQIKGKEITAVNSAVLISKLTQVACGVTYAGEEGKAEIDFGPRLAVLKEAIEESESKIIVFVPFTGVLDALYRELSKEWTCAVVDGGTSSGRRNQIFDEFRSTPNPRVLIANPQTMSHGLTLTEADTIIWYAPIYSAEYFQQANARIVRPGQTKKTNIVHISATAVERRIYAVLREKGALQDVILELAKDGK
jgi:SNF2 family DNA or RNA helicase